MGNARGDTMKAQNNHKVATDVVAQSADAVADVVAVETINTVDAGEAMNTQNTDTEVVASEAVEAVEASDAPEADVADIALLDPNAVLPVVIPTPEAGNALAIPESLFASLLACTHAHHLPYQAAIVQYVDSVESAGFANKLVCDLLRIGVRRAFTEALNTISHQDLEGRVAQIHGLLRAMSAGYSRPAAYAAYLKSLEPKESRTPKLRLAGFAKYIAIADVIRTMLASPDVTDKQRAGYKFMLDNLSLTNKAQADAMYAKMEAHPGCSKVLAYALEVIAVERAKAAAEAAAAAQAATSDADLSATMDELF